MKNRIFKEQGFNLKNTINILILAMLISGLFGFILETALFYFKLGYFVKRGSTFGPIVPIYTYGALLIILVTYRLKDKPLLVFVSNLFLTGILEYSVGYILYTIFNIRLWDYSNEFLNIKGLICLKSVLCFGIGSLLLIYIILPIIFKIVKKMPENIATIVSYGLGIIYLLDVLLYSVIK